MVCVPFMSLCLHVSRWKDTHIIKTGKETILSSVQMTQISIYEEYAYTSIWRKHHNHQHTPQGDQMQREKYKICSP